MDMAAIVHSAVLLLHRRACHCYHRHRSTCLSCEQVLPQGVQGRIRDSLWYGAHGSKQREFLCRRSIERHQRTSRAFLVTESVCRRCARYARWGEVNQSAWGSRPGMERISRRLERSDPGGYSKSSLHRCLMISLTMKSGTIDSPRPISRFSGTLLLLLTLLAEVSGTRWWVMVWI